MISIRQPLYFSEIGKKNNQEDCLYPAKPSKETRVFILCDGMGGHDNGEVASQTVAEALGGYLTSAHHIDIPAIEAGLTNAYRALDGIESGHGKTPGTTMTCLCINSNNYIVAHIGDSRIYHIRPSLYDHSRRRGGILYQSSDHSLVNDLIKAGELNEEEARDFPGKNIITRAMQPGTRSKADVYQFDNIVEGDYFFMCSDGVMEQLSNETLCGILASNDTDNDKIASIASVCNGNTRDNYSCWLIPVDKTSVSGRHEHSNVIKADIDSEPGKSFLKKLFSKNRRP